MSNGKIECLVETGLTFIRCLDDRTRHLACAETRVVETCIWRRKRFLLMICTRHIVTFFRGSARYSDFPAYSVILLRLRSNLRTVRTVTRLRVRLFQPSVSLQRSDHIITTRTSGTPVHPCDTWRMVSEDSRRISDLRFMISD